MGSCWIIAKGIQDPFLRSHLFRLSCPNNVYGVLDVGYDGHVRGRIAVVLSHTRDKSHVGSRAGKVR